MTPLEVASFLGLGILANTAFPMPFEPILVAFSGGLSRGDLVLLCVVGSLCAGVAALVDAGCLGIVRRRIQGPALSAPEHAASFRFYAFTAAAAMLPVPFTLVRAGLLRARPRPLLFASIVALARCPRYLFTVFAWGALALPAWAGWALAGLTLLAALEWRHATRRRRVVSPIACPASDAVAAPAAI